MSKSIQPVIDAFLLGNNKKVSNTQTNGIALYLHGNKIAMKGSDGMYVSTANWNTRTTLDRLNMLPGVSVTYRKGQLNLNGNHWDGTFIKI